MRISRRKFLYLSAGLAALPAASPRASANTYPSRPVRILAGFAAGGGVDITARIIGQWLSNRLGQSFITENRPGAGGNIATDLVVNAPPDGYTLLLSTVPNAVNATLYDNLGFDFMRDTAPVAGIIRVAMVVLVHPSVPANTLPEFLSYVKANPGKVNMASAGIGSAPHMAGELFNFMAGVKMVHVPYRGQGPALADLLGGQVQVLFATTPGITDYIKSARTCRSRREGTACRSGRRAPSGLTVCVRCIHWRGNGEVGEGRQLRGHKGAVTTIVTARYRRSPWPDRP
jgi:tripartite-type tricarboxylate transporter receptor subunit TctC